MSIWEIHNIIHCIFIVLKKMTAPKAFHNIYTLICLPCLINCLFHLFTCTINYTKTFIVKNRMNHVNFTHCSSRKNSCYMMSRNSNCSYDALLLLPYKKLKSLLMTLQGEGAFLFME